MEYELGNDQEEINNINFFSLYDDTCGETEKKQKDLVKMLKDQFNEGRKLKLEIIPKINS